MYGNNAVFRAFLLTIYNHWGIHPSRHFSCPSSELRNYMNWALSIIKLYLPFYIAISIRSHFLTEVIFLNIADTFLSIPWPMSSLECRPPRFEVQLIVPTLGSVHSFPWPFPSDENFLLISSPLYWGPPLCQPRVVRIQI